MKFYQKEKSKLGNAPGTIINWSVRVMDNDPDASQNKSALPAGYLRCDGSVYSAALYPQLANILGKGASCIYKKTNQTLLDTQFQVPDLGSKHIEAATSANVGQYRNMEKTVGSGENTNTVIKAGVGVEITSNVGTTATIGFNGVFTVPQQTFALNGNVGWTIPTTSETESVSATAIGSHGHFANTYRVAVKDDPAHADRSQPSYLAVADAPIDVSNSDCQARAREYYEYKGPPSGEGNCNVNCGNWKRYFMGWAQGSGNSSQGATTTDTGINYQSLWPTNLTVQSKTATSWPAEQPINIGWGRPYDTRVDDTTLAYPAARNTEIMSEAPPGSDTTDFTAHSHRLSREVGETSYQAQTDVTTVRPDGLEANVTIRTSTVSKFDDVVSPYVVLEYLIKY